MALWLEAAEDIGGKNVPYGIIDGCFELSMYFAKPFKKHALR